MDPKEYRSKTGPLPEVAFDGDVEFKPTVNKAYGPESAARMKALHEKLLNAKTEATVGEPSAIKK
jgi:hypothetical protein